jgi:hypothetical protein
MEENERKIVFEDDSVILVDVQQPSDIEYYAPDDIKKELIDEWGEKFRDGDFYIMIDKNKVWSRFYIYKDLDGDLTSYDDDFETIDYENLIEVLKERNLDSVIPYISEIKGHGVVYQTLLDILSGKITSFRRWYDFKEIDDLISNIDLKTNPGKSIISITFSDEEEFMSIFDDYSDDDIWFIKSLFSYYDGYEFMDSYRADEEWREGYILNYFNEDNTKKLKDIFKYINPNLVNFDESDSDGGEACKFLDDLYSNEVSYIVGEFSDVLNAAANEEAKSDITKDFCDILTPYYIVRKNCMSDYLTSVGLLKKLYDRASSTDLTLLELFKETFANLSVPGGYAEQSYEYGWGTFDREEFNREVTNQLDKIYNKITEEYTGDLLKIYTDIISKYGIDKTHPIPASDGYSFKIRRVDADKDTIVINKFKTGDSWGKSEEQSYTMEEFNDFLHNYKIIETKRRRKIIKEQSEPTVKTQSLNFIETLPSIKEKEPIDFLKNEIKKYNSKPTTKLDIDLDSVLQASLTPESKFKINLFGILMGDTQKVIKTLSYKHNPNIEFTLTFNPLWEKTLPGVNIKLHK